MNKVAENLRSAGMNLPVVFKYDLVLISYIALFNLLCDGNKVFPSWLVKTSVIVRAK